MIYSFTNFDVYNFYKNFADFFNMICENETLNHTADYTNALVSLYVDDILFAENKKNNSSENLYYLKLTLKFPNSKTFYLFIGNFYTKFSTSTKRCYEFFICEKIDEKFQIIYVGSRGTKTEIKDTAYTGFLEYNDFITLFNDYDGYDIFKYLYENMPIVCDIVITNNYIFVNFKHSFRLLSFFKKTSSFYLYLDKYIKFFYENFNVIFPMNNWFFIGLLQDEYGNSQANKLFFYENKMKDIGTSLGDAELIYFSPLPHFLTYSKNGCYATNSYFLYDNTDENLSYYKRNLYRNYEGLSFSEKYRYLLDYTINSFFYYNYKLKHLFNNSSDEKYMEHQGRIGHCLYTLDKYSQVIINNINTSNFYFSFYGLPYTENYLQNFPIYKGIIENGVIIDNDYYGSLPVKIVSKEIAEQIKLCNNNVYVCGLNHSNDKYFLMFEV